MNRKGFLQSMLGLGAIFGFQSTVLGANIEIAEEFSLAPLPYSFDALEPFIDKQTMEIHYGKHHKAYVSNLNKAIVGTAFVGKSLEEMMPMIRKNTPAVIRNNAGGHWNHTFFWNILSTNSSKKPQGALLKAIEVSFGSFDSFKEEFSKASMGRFGSGWAWLVLDANKKLKIVSTPNQDNPLMRVNADKGTPLLALDLWEHAYYLKYQNKRADYIASFWNIINWDKAEELYKKSV